MMIVKGLCFIVGHRLLFAVPPFLAGIIGFRANLTCRHFCLHEIGFSRIVLFLLLQSYINNSLLNSCLKQA